MNTLIKHIIAIRVAAALMSVTPGLDITLVLQTNSARMWLAENSQGPSW